ncbi:MAG: M23 family metallopeptidase [Spirochaetales bacterium]|nr:M23 family metallopeptidase [Spirochaetales bacterium]
MNLRDQAINFYLPNSRMFESGFGTDITQFSENYNLKGNNNNHKGIDIAKSRFGPTIAGQQFNSIFSGNVSWTALNTSTFYTDKASWEAQFDGDSQSLDNLLLKSGNGKYWKDSRYGGNTVAINQGFNFNGSFMDMGFNTRSNHFESIIANSGYLNAGSGIGKAGNTGSSTGSHVDWNVYINDPYGTGNFLGSLYNLDFNQAYTNTTGERYYDPRELYDLYY